MRKKAVSIVLCLLIFWVNVIGTQRVEWEGQGDEINISYAGENGTVQLWASSDNYSYSFTMSAEEFQGTFQGNGAGFTNEWMFKNGGHISVIDASGTVIQTASGAEAGRLLESLSTSGVASDLNVRIVIEGEKVSLETEPEKVIPLPPPPPMPIIITHYIYNEEGYKIGGYFENKGKKTFQGQIKFAIGLSYAQSWLAESITYYNEGNSGTLIIKPEEKLPFYILYNPQGGLTFVFPSLISNDLPLSFSVFPPASNSQAVANFKEMIYKWWTGYKDPEPDVDYVNIKLTLKGTGKSRKVEVRQMSFFEPIGELYFEPPR